MKRLPSNKRYGSIGITRTTALAYANNSIDSLHLPRSDAGAFFACLVDKEAHGRWRITPGSALAVLGGVAQAWEVWSMLTLTAPKSEHLTDTADDGSRTTWMAHLDGSWAGARTLAGERTMTVHQGGRRRLCDLLEEIRWRWIEHGELPVYRTHVGISPDGTMTFSRGGWSAIL